MLISARAGAGGRTRSSSASTRTACRTSPWTRRCPRRPTAWPGRRAARGRSPARRPGRRPVDDGGGAGELARPAPRLASDRRGHHGPATAAGCAPTRPAQMWPRTDPAVIVLVHDGDGRSRTAGACSAATPPGPGSRRRVPRYSCLAGFVEPGESAEHAVVREVAEEVGVHVQRPDVRGEPAVAVPGLADARLPRPRRPGRAAAPGPEEIADARWFTRAEIRRPPRRRS